MTSVGRSHGRESIGHHVSLDPAGLEAVIRSAFSAWSSWSIDRRMKKALVIRALMMAVNLRKPPPGLMTEAASTPVMTTRNY